MVHKIIINGEKVIELSDLCRFEVRDNKLYNLNTNCFEGVDGDTVRYKSHDNSYIEDEVDTYTIYQVINGKRFGLKILSADECPATFIHRSKVEAYE